jgi:hypothetical protein
MPSAWGWRREDTATGTTWRPQGRRVGWLDGEQLLLEPEASYAAAQALAGEMGEALAVSPRTLRRRLHERGLLVSVDIDREVLTVRRTLEGRRREVIHLCSGRLSPPEPDQPDQSATRPHLANPCAGGVDDADPTNGRKPDQRTRPT